jgi:hypothetical protein
MAAQGALRSEEKLALLEVVNRGASGGKGYESLHAALMAEIIDYAGGGE